MLSFLFRLPRATLEFFGGKMRMVLFAEKACLNVGQQLSGSKPFAVVLTNGFEINFSALHALAASSRHARDLLVCISHSPLSRDGRGNMSDFLEFMLTKDRLRGLSKSICWQLLLRLADWVEAHILLASGGKTTPQRLLTVAPAEIFHDVPFQNVAYTQAAKMAVQQSGELFLSGSVDKSRVKSFGLSNGAFALPSNVAFFAPNQDRFVLQNAPTCKRW